MQVELRHSPSFAVARCLLNPNERIKVQPGAMMAQSFGIEVDARMDGGLFAGLSRAFAGESFTVSTFSAPSVGGWIDVVPDQVGDVFVVDVSPETGFVLTSGAWLANDGDIDLKADGSFSSWAAGAGAIILRARGQGKLIGTTYGAIDVHSLKAGEGFTVDTGHLVAWEDTVEVRTRKIGGFISSVRSGEGLVADVMGPGDVITQSRITPVITKT